VCEDDGFAAAGGEGDAYAFVALGEGGKDGGYAFFLVVAEFDGGRGWGRFGVQGPEGRVKVSVRV